MAHPLRATQQGYQNQLDQIDRQLETHEKASADLKARRAQVADAKKGIDELVAKLPAEPKAKPAKPASNKSAAS